VFKSRIYRDNPGDFLGKLSLPIPTETVEVVKKFVGINLGTKLVLCLFELPHLLSQQETTGDVSW